MVNVGPLPKATQRNWLAMVKAKEVAGVTSSQDPMPSQPIEAPLTQSLTSPVPPEHTKYYAVCTPLGNICPKEYPMSLDLDEDLKDEDRKDHNEEDQKDSEGKIT